MSDDGMEVTGATEISVSDWPGEVGGLITNDEYQFNVAQSILMNRKTKRMARVTFTPNQGGMQRFSPSPEYLRTIVTGVQRFLPSF